MGILIIGGVLFGAVLGRYFKVFILLPACALGTVLVAATPTVVDEGLWSSIRDICILVTSLQVGYALGLVTGNMSSFYEQARPFWGHRTPYTASR